MIAPELAVRPRVFVPGEGICLLVDEVAARLDRGDTGYIALIGARGSGRSTALEHLSQAFAGDARLRLIDGSPLGDDGDLDDALTICTVAVKHRPCEVWKLAPWTRDDCIEYLLGVYPRECAEVVARLDAYGNKLAGLPELWRAVLDQLATDESVTDVRSALRAELHRRLSDRDGLRQACSGSLRMVCRTEDECRQELAWWDDQLIGPAACRWLRHEPVRMLLAADELGHILRSGARWDVTLGQFPAELVRELGPTVKNDQRCLDSLMRILKAGPPLRQPMAMSLLHAAGKCPMPEHGVSLEGAHLQGVHWPGADLATAKLWAVDLSNANLHEADLRDASASWARFDGADLQGARLTRMVAPKASFQDADLRHAQAKHTQWNRADLRGAILDGALLRHGTFGGADLRGASLVRANLIETILWEVQLDGADFTAADLSAAKLSGLVLRVAEFAGAQFDDAKLDRCDLEGMTLPGASFEGANLRNSLLTGTRIPDGKFRDADLRGAALAEIDWERADLRDADLSNCTFHLGSTRSGLVGSPIASEGSRTGFYTDELEEQGFKAPEEIRKANLRGADLRGADIEHTDFYLVDLRDAKYTWDQEWHFRRTGAILEARV